MNRFLLIALFVCPAFCGEYAVLRTGFRLYALRHESVGEMVRLHTDAGSVDLRAAEVVGFDVEEYVAPKPLPAAALPPIAVIAEPSPAELLEKAARKNGLRPEFVHSVAAVESAYNVAAISPKGAIGLMQLMPGTAKELGANPNIAAENADAGARYLKQLLLRYQNSSDPVRLALAAYNAGPGAVDRHGSIPPYRETQAYVERVLRKYLLKMKRGT